MGDPAKIRKKYARPRHPWEMDRIEEERGLLSEYGLKSKQEIWKMDSLLKSFKDQVKKLNAMSGEQAEKEKKQLLEKLRSLGVLGENSPMDDVLGLDIRSIMERRLQSIVYRKGLARSMTQARQFVVHEHVKVDDKKVTVPSYLVRVGEEVAFADDSPFKDEMHPERIEKKPSKTKVEKEKEEKKEEDAEEELAYDEDEIIDEEEAVEKKAKEKIKKKAEKAKKEVVEESSEAPEEDEESGGKAEEDEKEEEDE